MNKRLLIYFLCICITTLPFHLHAQQEGIRFEHDLSWSAIVAKATAENKFVFVDCSATWCGPCKFMEQAIFTQKAVGDFFNSHFLNVHVQMDRKPNDPDEIRRWYNDAKQMESTYAIKAYPTFLFFSPNGQPVDRFTGSYQAEAFIAKATDALSIEKQYYTFLNAYKEHEHDSLFLRSALEKAIGSSDDSNASKIADLYLANLQDPFSPDNIRFLSQINICPASRLFSFCIQNAKRIDTILGAKKEYIENTLCERIRITQVVPMFSDETAIINYNDILSQLQAEYPQLADILPRWIAPAFDHFIKKTIHASIYKEDAPEPNWHVIKEKVRFQFPGYDCTRSVEEMKPEYYKYKHNWPACEQSTVEILEHFGNTMTAHDLDNLIWDYLFMYSSNPKLLKIGLKWSKRVVDMDTSDCANIDTYANIFYKLGNRKNALKWERKAAEHCGVSSSEIRANFEKMKKGERTWASKEHSNI